MKQYASRNHSEIPLFRTMQWAWFIVALMFSYRLDVFKAPMATVEKIMPYMLGRNDRGIMIWKLYVHQYLEFFKKYHEVCTFVLYVVTFCVTILLFRKDRYRYQIRVLSFTFLALALIVLQLKVAIYNVFSGLVWFLLPVMLVITNDTFAYICGKSLGRKIVKWEFLKLSPNKTWEGYIGAGVFTMIMGWYLPRILGHHWLTCSFRELEMMAKETFISNNDGVMNSSSGSDAPIQTCHSDYLFELKECTFIYVFPFNPVKCMPAQVHGLVLSIFASIVAPFGGFFASAIKRAYNIKDFDSVIPGHGGAMDRLDCQFIMALATYVYCHTYLKTRSDAVNEVIDSIRDLRHEEIKEVISRMNKIVQKMT